MCIRDRDRGGQGSTSGCSYIGGGGGGSLCQVEHMIKEFMIPAGSKVWVCAQYTELYLFYAIRYKFHPVTVIRELHLLGLTKNAQLSKFKRIL